MVGGGRESCGRGRGGSGVRVVVVVVEGRVELGVGGFWIRRVASLVLGGVTWDLKDVVVREGMGIY